MTATKSAGASARCPALEPIEEVVHRVLPGKSTAVQELRESVIQVCIDPGARAVLLRGSIGTGKSTIARVIAFGKRIAALRQEGAAQRVKDLRFEGPGRIDLKIMPWYREFTVTGLVDEQASAQLFGIKKGTATGVEARRGVFARAKADDKGKPWDGAGATGGVVFLDEIADISAPLQAKLLPVLSGGTFYPVGGEGESDSAATFDGVLISATWQTLDHRKMRQDLLSRLSARVIRLPGISERIEDLADIVDHVRQFVVDRHRARIEEMIRAEPNSDRAFWTGVIEALEARKVDDAELAALSRVEWSRYGEMRGLQHAVERIMFGAQPISEILADLQPLGADLNSQDGDLVDGLYARLMARDASGDSLSSHVREVERGARSGLKTRLIGNPRDLDVLAERLGIERPRLVEQVRQLDRDRRRRGVDGEES